MIKENHIHFLETLCKGPVISSEHISKSYIFLKKKGVNINMTAISRNTARNARKIKNEKFERRRFRIYWIDGFELETVQLFHQMLNYKKIQWKNIYLPIVGSYMTNKLKGASRKCPTIDEKIYAKELPSILDKRKKESIKLIKDWIEKND